MSQCVGKTKTGARCSRIVKDGGNLCFQHKQTQPSPKAQTPPKAQTYGRKVKLLKPECLKNPDKYVWTVGKGCFEKSQAQAQPQTQPQPPQPPSLEALRCVWFKCVDIEPKDRNGISIVTFPKEYFLFRSARESKFKIPSWFSDEEGAMAYARLNPNLSCKRYITKKKLRLVDISEVSNLNAMWNSPLLTNEEKYVVSYVSGINTTPEIEAKRRAHKKIKKKGLLVFSPVGFLTKEDMRKGDYVNLLFARIVCKFGYDGWLIPRRTIIDGSHGHYFVQEVMLCNPEDVLTKTEISCKL